MWGLSSTLRLENGLNQFTIRTNASLKSLIKYSFQRNTVFILKYEIQNPTNLSFQYSFLRKTVVFQKTSIWNKKTLGIDSQLFYIYY